jgi:hypothetical protein
MGEILDAVIRFFHEDDWSFVQIEDRSALQLGFQGDNGQWPCYVESREEFKQFTFYSVCPVNVPEEKRFAMAEFLTRANYGLVIGNFEMDMDDGEILYKTSIDVQGDELSPSLVRNAVYVNVTMMDRYLPGIMSVVYGSSSPAEAIAQVEGRE